MRVDMPANAVASNLQKKAKKAQHEQEKVFMLRGAGCTVGKYVGDGQGTSVSVGSEGGTLDAGPKAERQELKEDADDDDENETGSEDHPLLILYDREAKGFSVYTDHITDTGAKIIAAPTPLLHHTFSSLVRTPRTIPAAGKKKNSSCP